MSAPDDPGTARLKAGLFVQACLQMCRINTVAAVVLHRGDGDAGQVLIKFDRLDGTAMVLSQVTDDIGRPVWLRATGPAPVPEADADAYIARQRGYDPDMWTLVIEDPACRHPLDERVID